MDTDLRRKKVMEAAIELLLEKDITKITTREVVQKAKVNISMLHYYFKTKNDLFSEALHHSTKIIFTKWIDENIDLNLSTINDIKKLINYILDSIMMYPSISKSISYMVLQGVNIEKFSFNFDELVFSIVSKISKLDKKEIIDGIHILDQMILSLRVTNSLVKIHTGLDLSKAIDRKKYTALILKKCFPVLYKEI